MLTCHAGVGPWSCPTMLSWSSGYQLMPGPLHGCALMASRGEQALMPQVCLSDPAQDQAMQAQDFAVSYFFPAKRHPRNKATSGRQPTMGCLGSMNICLPSQA